MVKRLKPRVGNRNFTYADYDANNNELLHWSGAWAAGTYAANEAVVHEGGAWVCIAASTTAEPGTDINAWVPIAPVSGRLGVNLAVPATGISIGGGWSTVPFDTITIPQYGMTVDLPSNQFAFLFEGAWLVALAINLTHGESNAGRTINLRLWNVTDGVAPVTVPIPIARNQPGTLIALSAGTGILAANLSKQTRLELGGGDTVAGVTLNAVELSFFQQTVPVT